MRRFLSTVLTSITRRPRSRACLIGVFALAVAAAATGCQEASQPTPRVAIPDRSDAPYERDQRKPLPGEPVRGEDLPPPPFDDVPLVTQSLPERRRFVESYKRVGRPRIAVFVNRTPDGEVVPDRNDAPSQIPDNRNADGGGGLFGDGGGDRGGGHGGGGEYNEVPIDYEAIESILTDWLSAEGQVEIVSPATVRRDNDVLVQVQARPTRATPNGPVVRMVAEAINVRGGQSIARAVSDVPPPMDKPQINKYTRYLSRKLMDGMTTSWDNLQPGDRATETRGAAESETRREEIDRLLEADERRDAVEPAPSRDEGRATPPATSSTAPGGLSPGR